MIVIASFTAWVKGAKGWQGTSLIRHIPSFSYENAGLSVCVLALVDIGVAIEIPLVWGEGQKRAYSLDGFEPVFLTEGIPEKALPD
jgi:hypothetical protein